jgi:hypothetical protein
MLKNTKSGVSSDPARPSLSVITMNRDRNRIVVVQFDEIMHETRDSVLFYFKDEQDDELPENELWLPRSLIEYDETTRQVSLPQYLAEEKGLIF